MIRQRWITKNKTEELKWVTIEEKRKKESLKEEYLGITYSVGETIIGSDIPSTFIASDLTKAEALALLVNI